ncbi:MAG TPA: hypothetical protein VFX16_34410 [Pseudonocardiaceae bacterium]|nr:hypothetical protein [Pseudonocardiaceae bacterium]
MRVTGYAYPWDVLDDPGFVDRATGLGVDEIAVAVAYHGTRAATPWQVDRAAVVAEHSALYRPVRDDVWRSRVLRPEPAGWMTTSDSAGDAIRALAGLPTAAWLVLTHNSLLGNRFPAMTTRDCFGQQYPWALCPTRAEVRDYAATLAAECVRDLPVDSVLLEACGQMGAVHQHLHEKTDAVWAPAVRRLLSICCCDACLDAWRSAGLDHRSTSALIREQVLAVIASGDLTRTDDDLPAELLTGVLACRQLATDQLRADVCSAIGRRARVVLHGSPDPWATGALPGLTPAAGKDVDCVVVPCWQPDQGVDLVAAARAALPAGVDVGAYVTAVNAAGMPDIAAYVRALADAGATELHLYHLGLGGPARLPDLGAAVTAAHQMTIG